MKQSVADGSSDADRGGGTSRRPVGRDRSDTSLRSEGSWGGSKTPGRIGKHRTSGGRRRPRSSAGTPRQRPAERHADKAHGTSCSRRVAARSDRSRCGTLAGRRSDRAGRRPCRNGRGFSSGGSAAPLGSGSRRGRPAVSRRSNALGVPPLRGADRQGGVRHATDGQEVGLGGIERAPRRIRGDGRRQRDANRVRRTASRDGPPIAWEQAEMTPTALRLSAADAPRGSVGPRNIRAWASHGRFGARHPRSRRSRPDTLAGRMVRLHIHRRTPASGSFEPQPDGATTSGVYGTQDVVKDPWYQSLFSGSRHHSTVSSSLVQ